MFLLLASFQQWVGGAQRSRNRGWVWPTRFALKKSTWNDMKWQYNGAQFSGTSWVFRFSAPTRRCVTVFHDLALDALWFYHILSVQLFQKLLRLELHWKTWKNKRELLILKEDYLSFYRSTKRNSSGAWKDYYRPEWSSNFDRNTSRSMASRPSPDASWTWPTETYCRNQTLPNHCPCHGVWSPV